MLTILDVLSALVDLLFSHPNLRDIRTKRRQQMEALDRRPPKDWERLV